MRSTYIWPCLVFALLASTQLDALYIDSDGGDLGGSQIQTAEDAQQVVLNSNKVAVSEGELVDNGAGDTLVNQRDKGGSDDSIDNKRYHYDNLGIQKNNVDGQLSRDLTNEAGSRDRARKLSEYDNTKSKKSSDYGRTTATTLTGHKANDEQSDKQNFANHLDFLRKLDKDGYFSSLLKDGGSSRKRNRNRDVEDKASTAQSEENGKNTEETNKYSRASQNQGDDQRESSKSVNEAGNGIFGPFYKNLEETGNSRTRNDNINLNQLYDMLRQSGFGENTLAESGGSSSDQNAEDNDRELEVTGNQGHMTKDGPSQTSFDDVSGSSGQLSNQGYKNDRNKIRERKYGLTREKISRGNQGKQELGSTNQYANSHSAGLMGYGGTILVPLKDNPVVPGHRSRRSLSKRDDDNWLDDFDGPASGSTTHGETPSTRLDKYAPNGGYDLVRPSQGGRPQRFRNPPPSRAIIWSRPIGTRPRKPNVKRPTFYGRRATNPVRTYYPTDVMRPTPIASKTPTYDYDSKWPSTNKKYSPVGPDQDRKPQRFRNDLPSGAIIWSRPIGMRPRGPNVKRPTYYGPRATNPTRTFQPTDETESSDEATTFTTSKSGSTTSISEGSTDFNDIDSDIEDFSKSSPGGTVKVFKTEEESDQTQEKKTSSKTVTQEGTDAYGKKTKISKTEKDEQNKADSSDEKKDFTKETSYGSDGREEHVKIDQKENNTKKKTDDRKHTLAGLKTREGLNGQLYTETTNNADEQHKGDIQSEQHDQTTEQERGPDGFAHTKISQSQDKEAKKYDQRLSSQLEGKTMSDRNNGAFKSVMTSNIQKSDQEDDQRQHKDKSTDMIKDAYGNVKTKEQQNQVDSKKIVDDADDLETAVRDQVNANGEHLQSITDKTLSTHKLDNKKIGASIVKDELRKKDGGVTSKISQKVSNLDQNIDDRKDLNSDDTTITDLAGHHQHILKQDNQQSRKENTKGTSSDKSLTHTRDRSGHEESKQYQAVKELSKNLDSRKDQKKLDKDILDKYGNRLVTSQEKVKASNAGDVTANGETLTRNQYLESDGTAKVVTAHDQQLSNTKFDKKLERDSRHRDMTSSQGDHTVVDTVKENTDNALDAKKSTESMNGEVDKARDGSLTQKTAHHKDTSDLKQKTLKESKTGVKDIVDTTGHEAHTTNNQQLGSDLINLGKTSESQITNLKKDRHGNEKYLDTHNKMDLNKIVNNLIDQDHKSTDLVGPDGAHSWVTNNTDNNQHIENDDNAYQQQDTGITKDASGNVAANKFQNDIRSKKKVDQKLAKSHYDKGMVSADGDQSHRIISDKKAVDDHQEKDRNEKTLTQSHDSDSQGNVDDKSSGTENTEHLNTHNLNDDDVFDETKSAGHGGPFFRTYQDNKNAQRIQDLVTTDKQLDKHLQAGRDGQKLTESSSDHAINKLSDDSKSVKSLDEEKNAGYGGASLRNIVTEVGKQHSADDKELTKKKALEKSNGIFGEKLSQSSDNYYNGSIVDNKLSSHDSDLSKNAGHGGPISREITSDLTKDLSHDDQAENENIATSHIRNENGDQMAESSDRGKSRSRGNEKTYSTSTDDEHNEGNGKPYFRKVTQLDDASNTGDKQIQEQNAAKSKLSNDQGDLISASVNNKNQLQLTDDDTHKETTNEDLRNPDLGLYNLKTTGVFDHSHAAQDYLDQLQRAKSMSSGNDGVKVDETLSTTNLNDKYTNRGHQTNLNKDNLDTKTGDSELVEANTNLNQEQQDFNDKDSFQAKSSKENQFGRTENSYDKNRGNKLVTDTSKSSDDLLSDVTGDDGKYHNIDDQHTIQNNRKGSKQTYGNTHESGSSNMEEHGIYRRSIPEDEAVGPPLRDASARPNDVQSPVLFDPFAPVISESETSDEKNNVKKKGNKVVQEREKKFGEDEPATKVPIDGTSAEACNRTCRLNRFREGDYWENSTDNADGDKVKQKHCVCRGKRYGSVKSRKTVINRETDIQNDKHYHKQRNESRTVMVDVPNSQAMIDLNIVSPKPLKPGQPRQIYSYTVYPSFNLLKAICEIFSVPGQEENLAIIRNDFPEVCEDREGQRQQR